MLEHAGLQIGALDVGRRQVVVQVVVVEGEVNCSAVHTAEGSRKAVAVVVVVVAVVVVVVVAVIVVVETESCLKDVGLKLVQFR